ncbi:Heme oxygenase 1, partial [Lamellibrachia satsuma]
SEQPELLISHAYTRYLGDVSGGQILKRIIGRLLSLPADGSGIAFFEFSRMESIPKFKQFYNSRMNSLELDDDTMSALVDEANVSFQFSVNV